MVKTFFRRMFAVVATVFFLAAALTVGATFLPGRDIGDQTILGVVLVTWLMSSLTTAWGLWSGATPEQPEQTGEANATQDATQEASETHDDNPLITAGARCCMSVGPAVGPVPAGQDMTRVCFQPATGCGSFNNRYLEADGQTITRELRVVIPLCDEHAAVWRQAVEEAGDAIDAMPAGQLAERYEQWDAALVEALASEAGLDAKRIKQVRAKIEKAMAGVAILRVSGQDALARVGAMNPPAPDKVRLA